MSLFDLKLEIDAVGEALVKQLDHLKTRFFAEIVEGMNECGHNFWMSCDHFLMKARMSSLTRSFAVVINPWHSPG